jgi:hypothetical protein
MSSFQCLGSVRKDWQRLLKPARGRVAFDQVQRDLNRHAPEGTCAGAVYLLKGTLAKAVFL